MARRRQSGRRDRSPRRSSGPSSAAGTASILGMPIRPSGRARCKTPSETCVDERREPDHLHPDRRAPAGRLRPCLAASAALAGMTVSTDHTAAEASEELPSEKVTTNALYLVAATIVTSLIGLLFWGLAARLNHHTSAFGSAYAGVSAMTLPPIVGHFTLGGVFTRFLPGAGKLS